MRVNVNCKHHDGLGRCTKQKRKKKFLKIFTIRGNCELAHTGSCEETDRHEKVLNFLPTTQVRIQMSEAASQGIQRQMGDVTQQY